MKEGKKTIKRDGESFKKMSEKKRRQGKEKGEN